jgi:hypothetical protein
VALAKKPGNYYKHWSTKIMAGKFEEPQKHVPKDVQAAGDHQPPHGDNLSAVRLPNDAGDKGFKISDAQLKSIQDGIKETEKALAASLHNISQCFAALGRPDSQGNTVDGKAEAKKWAQEMGNVHPDLIAMATGDKNAKS